MTPLTGHTSQETAYLVNDYPYGGLRCRIRFWLEQHPKRGFRFVSQTENPKTGRWNNPKQGTYSLMAASLYLDENNHVQYKTLTEYSGADETLAFLKDFPEASISLNLKIMTATRVKMTERTISGEHNFTIGGVAQKPSEEDIRKANEELPKWKECVELIKARNV